MCGVYGLTLDAQPPGMIWVKKSGGNLAQTGRVAVEKLDNFHLNMIIRNGTTQDSDVYVCRVSHQNETKEASFEVYFFEEIKFAYHQPAVLDPRAGEDVTVSCAVDTTNRTLFPKVLWQKGLIAVTADSPRQYDFMEGGQVLRIPKFDPKKDSGHYECKVFDVKTGSTVTRAVKIGDVSREGPLAQCANECTNLCSQLQ